MLYGISAMPTFCFMRSKRKLEDVKGADPIALENAIKKHLQNSENKKDQVKLAWIDKSEKSGLFVLAY